MEKFDVQTRNAAFFFYGAILIDENPQLVANPH